jgi:hypothetical protein
MHNDCERCFGIMLTSNGYAVSIVTVEPSARVAFAGISSVTAAPFVAGVAITTCDISFGHPVQRTWDVSAGLAQHAACHTVVEIKMKVAHLDWSCAIDDDNATIDSKATRQSDLLWVNDGKSSAEITTNPSILCLLCSAAAVVWL